MPTAVQFSIALDNTAGTLAKLCAILRKAKVNIDAITISDNTDCGWVRIVTSSSVKARAALEKAGYTVCAQLVLRIEADNRPGELEKICQKLSKAGINVGYAYGSTPGSTLVLGVDDVEKAERALGKSK